MSRNPLRHKVWVVALVLGVAMVPALAFAAHPAGDFTDVPDDHTFHDDIQWMHDSGITRGCNPPANDEYCPDRELIRAEEAAFFHRYDSFLRNSIEHRLLPEDCETNQVAEFNGDSWECSDRGELAPPTDGLSVTPGDEVVLEPGDADIEVTASCADGEVAFGGSLVPVDANLTYDGPAISGGDVTFSASLDAAATDSLSVTAYALCAAA